MAEVMDAPSEAEAEVEPVELQQLAVVMLADVMAVAPDDDLAAEGRRRAA